MPVIDRGRAPFYSMTSQWTKATKAMEERHLEEESSVQIQQQQRMATKDTIGIHPDGRKVDVCESLGKTVCAREVECLRALSENQRDVVLAEERVVRVIAGPGSGKTRVLIARAAYLLSLGIPANAIMLLTFTRKAANEMKSRLKTAIDNNDLDQLWAGTFHSIAAKMLRQDIKKLDTRRSSNFSIIDTSESKSIVSEIVTSLLTKENGRQPPKKEISAKSKGLVRLIAQAKDTCDTVHGLTGKEVQRICFAEYLPTGLYAYFSEVFDKYTEKLQEENLLDFGDLLSCTVALLRSSPQVLASYRRRFRHILVDEMQDINGTQYSILQLLTTETIGSKRPRSSMSLFVVGDPNQGIYAFRGAQVENLNQRMCEDFDEEMVTKTLTENYRSLSPIVKVAEKLLKQDLSESAYTEMKVMRKEQPEYQVIRKMYNYQDVTEADDIVDRIVDLHKKGVPHEEIAILYRMHRISKPLENALARAQIPYCIKRTGFFERKEIKDIVCFLRFVVNPMDAVAFDRIYNVPSRGIGEKSYKKLKQYAEKQRWDFPRYLILDVMETITNDRKLENVIIPEWKPPKGLKLYRTVASGVRELRRIFVMLRSVARTGSPADVINCLVQNCRYREVVKHQENDQTTDEMSSTDEEVNPLNIELTRRNNIDILRDAVPEIQPGDDCIGLEAVTSFVQHLLLCQEAVDDNRGVQLLTLHAAKGLEFKYVFIIGCEEGRLPLESMLVDEEARLMFVGMTRAVDQLTFCVSPNRIRDYSQYGKESRFLRCVNENQ